MSAERIHAGTVRDILKENEGRGELHPVEIPRFLLEDLAAAFFEGDALRAQVARLQADLDATRALSGEGAMMVASLADRHDALRLAAEAYLDAEHRVDPEATAAARQQLRALVGWTPPREVLRPRGIATLHPSAARRMGLGGGSGTRSGEG